MLYRLLIGYGNLVKRKPLITQVTTAGVLTTTGDIIAQLIEQQPAGYDIRRTAVMSTFGFCYFGPIGSVWLGILKSLNMRVIPTVACDQIIAAPLFNGGFVFLHPILSQQSFDEAKDVFKTSFLKILKSAWLFWTPAQIINFSIVPTQFRMLYIQSVALAWNTFLSYFSNSAIKKKKVSMLSNTDVIAID